MALPSAQLGQMPNMNIPYSVPYYQKEPKPWEKVLLSLVSSAGGAALNQGIQNSMARDFADLARGETPSSGFDAFLHGPRVSERQQNTRDQLAGQIGLEELRAQPSARDMMEQRNVESQRIDRNMDSMRDTMSRSQIARRSDDSANARSMNEQAIQTERATTELEGLNQADRHQHAQEILQRLGQLETNKRAEMTDKREEPYRAAQTAEQIAKAEGERYRTQIARQAMEGQAKPGAGKVSPNVINEYATPESTRAKAVRERLMNTQQYPTAEAIMSKGQPPVTNAVTSSYPYQGMIQPSSLQPTPNPGFTPANPVDNRLNDLTQYPSADQVLSGQPPPDDVMEALKTLLRSGGGLLDKQHKLF